MAPRRGGGRGAGLRLSPSRSGSSHPLRDLRSGVQRGLGECGHRPRYGGLCGGKHPPVVDGGGSNGSRVRLWKWELQHLADEIGLAITVCHLPPGTSKWNKIEHRLFAWISQNWRGKPLVDYAIIVKLIAATTTEAGLTVQCQLDTNRYPTGCKISDEQMSTLL